MDESDKVLALRVLRATLHDGDAKPADKLRAAQLLLEHDAPAAGGQASLHDATDAELLVMAKGGMPRSEGPAGNSDAAVPSASTEDRPPTPMRAGPAKGTQRGPVIGMTPGGPKEDPWAKKPRAAPKMESTVDPQIKLDNTPPTPGATGPMPWE